MKKIKVEDLSVVLSGKFVLNNISVQFEEGRIYGILGPSGAGKSVFIKTVFGIFQPKKGRMEFENIQKVAIQFQEGGLFDHLTVADNIAFQVLKGKKLLSELDNLSKNEIFGRVFEATKFLNISDAIFKFPSELSGGMKKRTVLGRALIETPDVVVLDDPVAGLDPINTTSAVRIISKIISKYNPIALICTHNFRAFWDLITDVCFFEHGNVLFFGGKSEALNHPRVNSFLMCKLK